MALVVFDVEWEAGSEAVLGLSPGHSGWFLAAGKPCYPGSRAGRLIGRFTGQVFQHEVRLFQAELDAVVRSLAL